MTDLEPPKAAPKSPSTRSMILSHLKGFHVNSGPKEASSSYTVLVQKKTMMSPDRNGIVDGTTNCDIGFSSGFSPPPNRPSQFKNVCKLLHDQQHQVVCLKDAGAVSQKSEDVDQVFSVNGDTESSLRQPKSNEGKIAESSDTVCDGLGFDIVELLSLLDDDCSTKDDSELDQVAAKEKQAVPAEEVAPNTKNVVSINSKSRSDKPKRKTKIEPASSNLPHAPVKIVKDPRKEKEAWRRSELKKEEGGPHHRKERINPMLIVILIALTMLCLVHISEGKMTNDELEKNWHILLFIFASLSGLMGLWLCFATRPLLRRTCICLATSIIIVVGAFAVPSKGHRLLLCLPTCLALFIFNLVTYVWSVKLRDGYLEILDPSEDGRYRIIKWIAPIHDESTLKLLKILHTSEVTGASLSMAYTICVLMLSLPKIGIYSKSWAAVGAFAHVFDTVTYNLAHAWKVKEIRRLRVHLLRICNHWTHIAIWCFSLEPLLGYLINDWKWKYAVECASLLSLFAGFRLVVAPYDCLDTKLMDKMGPASKGGKQKTILPMWHKTTH